MYFTSHSSVSTRRCGYQWFLWHAGFFSSPMEWSHHRLSICFVCPWLLKPPLLWHLTSIRHWMINLASKKYVKIICNRWCGAGDCQKYSSSVIHTATWEVTPWILVLRITAALVSQWLSSVDLSLSRSAAELPTAWLHLSWVSDERHLDSDLSVLAKTMMKSYRLLFLLHLFPSLKTGRHTHTLPVKSL